MAKQKQFKMSKDDLEYEEPVDEISFGEYIPAAKDSLATFSFNNDNRNDQNTIIPSKDITTPPIKKESCNNTLTTIPDIDIFDNRTTPIANGSAPSINGESPTLKRTYILRQSTVKKINELKAIHSDPSTCVSTIVDIAIEHYYECIKNRNIMPFTLDSHTSIFK